MKIGIISSGVPVAIAGVLFLQFIERSIGKTGKYVVSTIGLFPLMLVIFYSKHGVNAYMIALVLSGLAWSAAWIMTSVLFLEKQG